MSKVIHKKVVAIATALILVFTLMGTALNASAKVNTKNNPVGNADVEFVAEKLNDTEIKISMKAKQDVTITNVTSYLKWSNNLSYAQTEVTAPSFSESEYNPAYDLFIANSGKNISFSAGETILYFTVTANEAIQEETDYSVTFTLDDAFYFDENGRPEGFDWSYDEYTVIYREDTYYTVTIAKSATEVIDTQEVHVGDKVVEPSSLPTIEGKNVIGWTVDGTNPYDFNTPVTSNLTISPLTEDIPQETSKDVELGKIKVNKVIIKADKLEEPNEQYQFMLTPLGDAPEYKFPLNITASGETSLLNAEFPGPGNYTYKITEVKGDNSNITYDTNEYYIHLKIEKNASGDLELTEFNVTAEENPTVDSHKMDSVTFENRYEPETTLKVSKTVVADEPLVSLDEQAFEFNITFTDPSIGNGVTTTEGSETKTVDYGTAYTFYLKDGESKEFTLPAGTDYTVTESAAVAYAASAEVLSGGAQTVLDEGKADSEYKITSVALLGQNSADVTNTYKVNAITGVIRKNAAIIVAILLAMAAIAALIYDKKRKLAAEEE